MLYLVRIDNSHLKIGYSTNVASRIKSFQTSSLQVELLAIREGDINHERELHEICKSYKLKNELFKNNQFVIDTFKNYIFQPDMDKVKRLEKTLNNQSIEITRLRTENKKLQGMVTDQYRPIVSYISQTLKLQQALLSEIKINELLEL